MPSRKRQLQRPLVWLICAGLLVCVDGAGAQAPKPVKRSPTGALLRSMALPGWGQVYNRKYLKAAVIGMGEALLIYQLAYYWRRTSRYEDLYLHASGEERADKFAAYEHYRDRRNQHVWFVGLTVLFSMFDAYVDAHLANFKIDLSPPFQDTDRAWHLNLGLAF